MKYSEFSLEGMHEVKVDIHERWKQLNTLSVDISERASKQLFITNGTGAIALMSYFGVAEKGRIFLEMKISLCFFVAGVFFAMVVTAILYHAYAVLLEGWRKDTGKFYSDEIEHENLYGNDEMRYKDSNETFAVITSYISFACFFLGSMATLAVMVYGRSAF